ncbi:hypothetical protein [Halegenticoccus soli]|nr:hypothetical protein [Halegenticoccus soli]
MFQKAIAEAGLGDRIAHVEHGDTYTFDAPADRTQSAADERHTRRRYG